MNNKTTSESRNATSRQTNSGKSALISNINNDVSFRISKFLSRAHDKNSVINEFANQTISSPVPEFLIQQTRESQIEVTDPKRFGNESETRESIISGTKNGQLLVWNEDEKMWELFTPTEDVSFLFYWSGSSWSELPMPEDENNLYVLAAKNNSMFWTSTINCEEGEQ
jgi:hypothetical protein